MAIATSEEIWTSPHVKLDRYRKPEEDHIIEVHENGRTWRDIKESDRAKLPSEEKYMRIFKWFFLIELGGFQLHADKVGRLQSMHELIYFTSWWAGCHVHVRWLPQGPDFLLLGLNLKVLRYRTIDYWVSFPERLRRRIVKECILCHNTTASVSRITVPAEWLIMKEMRIRLYCINLASLCCRHQRSFDTMSSLLDLDINVSITKLTRQLQNKLEESIFSTESINC